MLKQRPLLKRCCGRRPWVEAELDAPVARTLAVARQRLEEAGIEVVEVAGPFPSILSQVGGPLGGADGAKARVLPGHGGLGCD